MKILKKGDKINKDKLLKSLDFITFCLMLIPFLLWYFYDYEKGQGSFILIFILVLFINNIIKTNRIFRFEDKNINEG